MSTNRSAKPSSEQGGVNTSSLQTICEGCKQYCEALHDLQCGHRVCDSCMSRTASADCPNCAATAVTNEILSDQKTLASPMSSATTSAVCPRHGSSSNEIRYDDPNSSQSQGNSPICCGESSPPVAIHHSSATNQGSRDTIGQQPSSVRLLQEEQISILAAAQVNLELLRQEVASLQRTVDDAQYTTFDGTLIWKITNVREKIMDAQSERQTSIYSPPFFSSPTGYKMRARLYLNGDGNARRTHMSLFFVLMRGPHDTILKFPFSYKVIFCLYDQTSQQRHIVDSFRPDMKSNSFQRPRSEMNIASGIPKFVPLSVLEQEGNPYVQDDTMFIKIMVDFGDMAKTMLPYALSLNPGLPMHIQHMMIQQEQLRRQQQSTEAISNRQVGREMEEDPHSSVQRSEAPEKTEKWPRDKGTDN